MLLKLNGMKLDNKEVAIVGGGPGGLTVAKLLQQKGVSVKVYERDYNKEARLQGSPLDLHEESGLAAIRKAGLLEAFKANFSPGADKKRIVNQQAEVFYSDHENKPEENFGDAYFRPEIDRGPLRSLLFESLAPETVVWDSHFTGMEKQNEGWQLHFKNGLSVYADFVIAADGANSKIRPYLTPIKAIYSGITMVEVTIDHSGKTVPNVHALLNGGKIMAFGNSKCLLMGLKSNDELTFYASLKVPENWAANNGFNYSDPLQLEQWFKDEYSDWSPFWHELFENAATSVVPRPIYCMPLDQNWETQSNLTLLGDAAHVMPPFAGEGVNMAMLDALELSECLTSDTYKTLPDAIAIYESSMRKRAAKAAQESLENGERMHSENALTEILQLFSGH